MVYSDGIEVWIERYADGMKYQEHIVPPESALFTGDANERYIEAVTDERFVVCARVMEDFDFKGAPAVRLILDLDRGSIRVCHTFERDAQGSRTHRFETKEFFHEGEWKCCGYTFGGIALGES